MYKVWFFDVPFSKLHTGEGNLLPFTASTVAEVNELANMAIIQNYNVAIEDCKDGE